MNTALGALLILTPLLPLLLAFPALRARLPWPCHVALLPAFILLMVPMDAALDLPWLLPGSGLGLDAGMDRWPLAMAVLVWGASASLLPAARGRPADERFTSCFLLTLAGSLGMMLATGLVGFFTFSVLMGYGFYALLLADGGARRRRAAGVYLVLLILADLALFEALLIAAATSGELGFAASRQAMAQSPSSTLYLSMVLAGFAAKAGLWPLYFWLPPAFASARPAPALLLGAAPVAMALLGLVRWLPLGDAALPGAGLVVQGLGVLTLSYAVLAGVKRGRPKCLPAWGTLFATGLFAIALGTGLGDPAAWHRYGDWAGLFIAAVGLGAALLVVAGGGLRQDAAEGRADDSPAWFERWPAAVVRRAARLGVDTLPRWRAAWQTWLMRLWRPRAWQRALDGSERFLQRWAVAVTLCVLLGMAVVLAGAASGT